MKVFVEPPRSTRSGDERVVRVNSEEITHLQSVTTLSLKDIVGPPRRRCARHEAWMSMCCVRKTRKKTYPLPPRRELDSCDVCRESPRLPCLGVLASLALQNRKNAQARQTLQSGLPAWLAVQDREDAMMRRYTKSNRCRCLIFKTKNIRRESCKVDSLVRTSTIRALHQQMVAPLALQARSFHHCHLEPPCLKGCQQANSFFSRIHHQRCQCLAMQCFLESPCQESQ